MMKEKSQNLESTSNAETMHISKKRHRVESCIRLPSVFSLSSKPDMDEVNNSVSVIQANVGIEFLQLEELYLVGCIIIVIVFLPGHTFHCGLLLSLFQS